VKSSEEELDGGGALKPGHGGHTNHEVDLLAERSRST
jgi:hypothetical protein